MSLDNEAVQMRAMMHGLTGRVLHWGTALLLAFGYMKGLDDVSQLTNPTTFVIEIYFALLLGGAFLARFIWMHFFNGSTRLPKTAPVWERKFAFYAHLSIYLGVATIVMSGLGIALGFSVVPLSGIFLTAMIGLHEVSLSTTAVLIGTHIVGALWHRFIRHDGIWESMLLRFDLVLSARRK